MHDCHEAMVKIKMAFRPDGKIAGGNGGDGLVLLDMDPNATGKKKKGKKGGADDGNNNVANFGEYYTQDMQGPIGGMLVEPVMLLDPNEPMMEGAAGGAFAIPFSLDPSQGGEGDNWIVAEEDDGDEASLGAGGRKKRARRNDSTLSTNAAANLTLDSDLGNMAPGGPGMEEESEEEGWGAFDPDADMKDDEEEDEDMHVFQPDAELENVENRGRESLASRVELVRGANDSVTSDRQLQMNETPLKDDSIGRPGSPAASEEPDFGNNGGGDIDFDVDSTTSVQPNAAVDGLSVDTTKDGDESSTGMDRRRSNLGDLEISGLDEDMGSKAGSLAKLSEEGSEAPKKKRKRNVGPKRMKKRRKIVIDNNATELTSEHMKAMLRDTSDIVQQNVPHLAAWPRDDVDEEDGYEGICAALQRLPTEQLLARPCIGDDGGLAPELLALWGRNMCKITGKAGTQLPFRMRGERGEEQRGAVAEKIMEEEAAQAVNEEEEAMEEEDVEKARSQQLRESMDGNDLNMMEDDVEFGGGDHDIDFGDEEEKQNEDAADLETPFDIQDEFGTVEYKNDDLAEDDDLSVHSDRSSFSLGAVNDLEKELYEVGNEEEAEDQPRQAAGDELVSHTTKWHKHTVRVLGMLKRNMESSQNAEEDDADLDDEEMNKPSQLSYNKLSAGCSRRTAAGVFFEMLQLKTWDFVELNQDKSYGDITIKPGLRFDEPPPAASN